MSWPTRAFLNPAFSTLRLAFQKLTRATNLTGLILEERFLRTLIWGRTEHSWERSLIPWEVRKARAFYEVAQSWIWTVAERRGGIGYALDLLFYPEGYEGEYRGDEGRRFRNYWEDMQVNMMSPWNQRWWWPLESEEVFRGALLELMRA